MLNYFDKNSLIENHIQLFEIESFEIFELNDWCIHIKKDVWDNVKIYLNDSIENMGIWLMLILYIVIGSIVDFVPVCKNGIIYLLVMYAIVNVATQSRGKRFVNNVFTCDIYAKNKEKSE